MISVRTPADGDGISASTLSVEISNSGSSRSTASPTFLIHRTMVPSAIDSPIWGITTLVAIETSKSTSHVSRVYRRAMRRVGGLAHGFRHGRVRVDRADELLDRAFELQGHRRFGDELGGARADHVHAENLVVLLVEDDLDEALGLAGHAGPREHAELELAGLHLEAALLRLLLGQADAADLRVAVRAARHLVVVDRTVLLAGDPLGQDDALGRGEMRELWMSGLLEGDDVADRRDTLDVRLERAVHLDVPAVHLQTCLFGAQAARHGSATDRHEQDLDVELRRLAVRCLGLDIDTFRAGLRAGDLGAGHELDALLLER